MSTTNTPVEIEKNASQPGAVPGLWRSFRNEVDRLFHRLDGGFGLPAIRRLADIEPLFGNDHFGTPLPAIDLTEDGKSYTIAAELPGLDERNVSVTIYGNYLVMKGEKAQETRKQDGSLHLSERSYGAFERSFRIPDSVEADKIGADFTKGVLTVTLPKSAAAVAASRKIEIKAA